jgi:Type II secretion system protein C
MKKLDKKQVPQFAALAAITAVGLGYTAYQLCSGSNQPRAATAATAPAGATTASPVGAPGSAVTTAGGAARNPAGTRAAVTSPVKELAMLTTLPPSFTADPFRPALTPESGGQAPPPRPAPPSQAQAPSAPPAPESVDLNAPPLPPSGEWTPRALAADFPRTEETVPVPGASSAPARPAPAAAPPSRPAITLTGVIQGDPSVAILRGAQDERQVVRVNDRVAGRYVVKSISPDGVLLAAAGGSRPDRWFLPLGADPKGKRL